MQENDRRQEFLKLLVNHTTGLKILIYLLEDEQELWVKALKSNLGWWSTFCIHMFLHGGKHSWTKKKVSTLE